MKYLSIKYKQHGKWHHFSGDIESTDNGDKKVFNTINKDEDEIGKFEIIGFIINKKCIL